MVLLVRAIVCSRRLSIQTTVVSGTVWPQFAMQVLTGGYEHPVWGRGSRRGLEMGPLSSPVVTAYRLPIVNHRPISHHFHSAPTCHGQTDRQTDGTGLAKGGTIH